MANYAYTASFTTAGNILTLAAGDNVYLGQDATFATTGVFSYGIVGVSGHHVILEGDLNANYDGIYYSGAAGQNRTVITEGGSLTANTYGAYDVGNNSVFLNGGTVSAQYGIIHFGTDTKVFNTGHIYGDTDAIYFGAATGTNTVVNSGDIVGTTAAIAGSSAVDKVYNTGLISGAISLGAGADLLDSRGGVLQGVADLGAGNDTAYGGSGADSIRGGDDFDVLRGKDGDDRLDGGLGNDTMRGGADEDEFHFTTALGIANIDTILDFKHGEDIIALDDTIFTALGLDIQKSEILIKTSGHNATNSSQHIIYDSSKGTLWYDIDGKGGTAAVKFAQLGTSEDHPTNLNYHDFAIV